MKKWRRSFQAGEPGREGGRSALQHRLLSLVSRENKAGADRSCSLLHLSRFPRPAKPVSSTPVSKQERSRNGSPTRLSQRPGCAQPYPRGHFEKRQRQLDFLVFL